MSTGPDPTPLRGDEFSATPPVSKVTPPGSGAALSAEELVILNEEIAAMAKAGLPLDQGLFALGRDMGRGRLREVTLRLSADLQAGHTLPESLERQGGRVPPYYAALLAAGVRSGKLGDVLSTLTIYARSVADFRASIIGALVYPTIVLILGIALIVVCSLVVLPKFVEIFAEFKMKLPLFTEIVFFIGNHALEVFVLPPIVVVTIVMLLRWRMRSTPEGRVRWARLVYSVPLIGAFVRSARLSGFAELLGILVEQKVPLPEALRLAAETSSDPLVHEGGKQIEKDLRQGTPFGTALKQQRLVPDLVVWMIAFGEKQGTLGASLKQVAQLYRRQAETRASFLRTILPPILIILVAVVAIGPFVFGLIWPMFNLLDGLSGGGKK